MPTDGEGLPKEFDARLPFDDQIDELTAENRRLRAEVAEERARADHIEGRLLDRIDALRAALRAALLGNNWLQYDESADRHFCLFCGMRDYGIYAQDEIDRLQHADDCPVLRRGALLGDPC